VALSSSTSSLISDYSSGDVGVDLTEHQKHGDGCGLKARLEKLTAKANATTELPKNRIKPVLLPPLAAGDEWISKVDLGAFRADLQALNRELVQQEGPADLAHLQKLCFWSNACGVAGVLTMGVFKPNIFTALALSTWTFTRWAVVAHHTCHGGYNAVSTATAATASSTSTSISSADGGSSSGKQSSRSKVNNEKWFHSKTFAVGSQRRRLRQWMDWMLPEAWSLEHNQVWSRSGGA